MITKKTKKKTNKTIPSKFNPVKDDANGYANRVIWSTETINAAIEGLNQGFKLRQNPFYENNTKLLKADLLFDRTPKELERYKECMNNILEFAKECQLLTPQGIQHIVLRDYQEEYLKHLQNNRLSVFIAPRQCGKTVTSAIFMLWYVLFNYDKNALVLGNKFKTAKEILDKIKNIFFYLPYYLRPGIRKWNESEIVFDNGCRVMAESTTINSGISYSFSCVLADEFAHVPPNILDKFYNQIFPTVTAGKARFIISSTQNGFNLFYKLYKAAENGENEYAPFKVDWWQVPEWNPDKQIWEPRTEEWHQRMAANLGGEEAFQKQYGTNFDVTGNTLVSAKCIRKMQNNVVEFKSIGMPGILYSDKFRWDTNIIDDINNLKKEFLTITIDLAEGLNQDSDIMNIHRLIWDARLERVCCECIGVCEISDITVSDFAEVVVDFISAYCNLNQTILSFESNTYGGLFYKSISIYTEKHPEKIWDSGIVARYEQDMFSDARGIDSSNKVNKKYIMGFKVTSSSKKGSCKIMKMKYEDGSIINRYTKFISQLENFSDNSGNGSFAATYGHDDIVMTEVQQAALMMTLKYKLLTESYKATLQANGIQTSDFINYYDALEQDNIMSRMGVRW